VSLKTSGGNETRLFGPIGSVDTANNMLVVRGVTVVYDGNTRDDDHLIPAGLQSGINLEVQGFLQSPGTKVLASRIKLAN
jgi:Domain of unknown function (DUF5666)